MNNSFAAGLFVGMLACVASLPLPALAQSSALVDAYMQKSGLDHVIGQIEGGMLRGIDRVEAQPQPQTPKLTPEQRERLRNAVKVAYGADRLIASVRSQLVALLPSGDTEVMVKWLDSPLGKRVTALEIAGSTPEASQRAMETAPKVLADMTPSRKNDLERLINSSGAANVSTAIVLAQEIGIARGMLQAAGTPVSDAPLKEADMDRFRKHVAKTIAPELLANSAVVYAPLSDDELRQYANALERASPRRVLDATSMALEKASWRLRSSSGERSSESAGPAAPAA